MIDDSIEFVASLKVTGKAIKIDSELEAEVIFSVPASELSEVVRLVNFAGQAFKVKISSI